jgi:gamma-glutamyltranspeptidase
MQIARHKGALADLQDYNLSAAEALRANRLHNQVIPNVTQLERESTHQGITVSGFSEDMSTQLRAKGHQIEWVAGESHASPGMFCS